MKINNDFTVSAPVDKAWQMILDLERVTPCLPGAALIGSSGDGYEGTMKVKIGPITANYKGNVKIEEADEANHRAVVEATGRDARGQGTASATIVATMQEVNGKTNVQVETDMKLTGRAAQFGRGIAQDVAAKMLGRFADCLEREMLGSGQEAAASSAPAASTSSTGASTSNGAAAQAMPPIVGGGTGGQIISGATPGLGTSVGGSVVSGGGPGAVGAPSTPAGGGAGDAQAQQATQQWSPQEEPEAFDLGEASRGAVLKRVGPIAAVAAALVLVIWLLRRNKS